MSSFISSVFYPASLAALAFQCKTLFCHLFLWLYGKGEGTGLHFSKLLLPVLHLDTGTWVVFGMSQQMKELSANVDGPNQAADAHLRSCSQNSCEKQCTTCSFRGDPRTLWFHLPCRQNTPRSCTEWGSGFITPDFPKNYSCALRCELHKNLFRVLVGFVGFFFFFGTL